MVNETPRNPFEEVEKLIEKITESRRTSPDDSPAEPERPDGFPQNEVPELPKTAYERFVDFRDSVGNGTRSVVDFYRRLPKVTKSFLGVAAVIAAIGTTAYFSGAFNPETSQYQNKSDASIPISSARKETLEQKVVTNKIPVYLFSVHSGNTSTNAQTSASKPVNSQSVDSSAQIEQANGYYSLGLRETSPRTVIQPPVGAAFNPDFSTTNDYNVKMAATFVGESIRFIQPNLPKQVDAMKFRVYDYLGGTQIGEGSAPVSNSVATVLVGSPEYNIRTYVSRGGVTFTAEALDKEGWTIASYTNGVITGIARTITPEETQTIISKSQPKPSLDSTLSPDKSPSPKTPVDDSNNYNTPPLNQEFLNSAPYEPSNEPRKSLWSRLKNTVAGLQKKEKSPNESLDFTAKTNYTPADSNSIEVKLSTKNPINPVAQLYNSKGNMVGMGQLTMENGKYILNRNTLPTEVASFRVVYQTIGSGLKSEKAQYV